MAEETARVALVTGATSGIGQACARRLAAGGWRVFGAGRRARDGEVEAGVEMLAMDVDDDASVRRGVAEIARRAGRIDAIVNNAGFSMRGAIEDTPIDEAKALFETNFFSVMRVCQSALPLMRANGGGHVVNIGSLAGIAGVPFTGVYSASKFALAGLSESMRYETRPFGVHVVLVEPGDFKSEIDASRRVAAPGESVYRAAFEGFLARRKPYAAAAPTPEPVAALVERIVNDPNPKARYVIAMPKQRLLFALKPYLPQKLFQAVMAKLLGV